MRALENLKMEDLIFLDIETVRIEKELTESSNYYEAWKYKQRYSSEMDKFGKVLSAEDIFDAKASLYAPFAKIICITIGKIIVGENGENRIKTHTFYDHDEKQLLIKFDKVISQSVKNYPNIKFVGFNSNFFDLPFIQKRFLVNGIKANPIFDLSGLKPWELKHIDIAELWKGTSFYQDSLVSLTACFGIESSKSDISGSETSSVYWGEEGGLERIARYCERDVIATINLFRKMTFEEIINKFESNLV
jgi:3'-5' exonuclease